MRVPSGSPSFPDPRPRVPASLRPVPVPRRGPFRRFRRRVPLRAQRRLGAAASATPACATEESAVDVPQGVLVVAESLNSTNDTLDRSLRVADRGVAGRARGALRDRARRRCDGACGRSRTMAETTDAIAAGDLARRVLGRRSSTEVARLEPALNEMLARIEAAFAEKSVSEQRLRQFVADASHELRTPLTSIRGYTELLRKGAFADEESRMRALRRVEREAAPDGGARRRPACSWPGSTRAAPSSRSPSTCSLVGAEAVDDARAVEPGRPIRLARPTPVMVLGDRDRLGQVAHNLVRNALRAHAAAAHR